MYDNIGKASDKFRVPMSHVDIECVYCGLREDIFIPKDTHQQWIECPNCGQVSKLNLAIIEYLD